MCVQEPTATVSKSENCVLEKNSNRNGKTSIKCSALMILDTIQVTNVPQPKERFKYPPYPLSTIELEKRASRYFRMSSEQTMKVCTSVPCYNAYLIFFNLIFPFLVYFIFAHRTSL